MKSFRKTATLLEIKFKKKNPEENCTAACLNHYVVDNYHGLLDILLVIVAARSIVIAVNYLNSDVALGKTGASFACWHSTEGSALSIRAQK